jgi:hypothetical protein
MPKSQGQILVFVRDFQLNTRAIEQIADLIVFVGQAPQVLPKRSSKFFVTPIELPNGVPTQLLRVPFFGRKSFEIDLFVGSGYGGQFDLEISGARAYLPYDETGGGGGNSTFKTIATQAAIAYPGAGNPSAYTFQYRVDAQNSSSSFDYMNILFSNWTADNDPGAALDMGIQANIEVHD